MSATETFVVEMARPQPARAITGPAGVGASTIYTGRGLLLGFSAAGGAAAGAFSLVDGADTTGQPLGFYDVAANAFAGPWYGPMGVEVERGLTVNVTAALADLVVYVAPLWRPGA